MANRFALYTNTLSELCKRPLPPRKVEMRMRPLAASLDGDFSKLRRRRRRRTRCREKRYRSYRQPSDRLTWLVQLRALQSSFSIEVNSPNRAMLRELYLQRRKEPDAFLVHYLEPSRLRFSLFWHALIHGGRFSRFGNRQHSGSPGLFATLNGSLSHT